jgi:glycosyltransferase involved in cell wall biosynthesis
MGEPYRWHPFCSSLFDGKGYKTRATDNAKLYARRNNKSGVKMRPLISIVIANYNYGRFLEEAIKSVVDQKGFESCELIIVDGGSTDNSVEVIKKYEDKIFWWVSEKDKGQSDAFNKGFSHASGEYLTWLNADDLLIPGSLSKLVTYLKENSDIEWVSGSTIYVDASCNVVTTGLKMFNLVAQIIHAPAWARITAPSTIFSQDLLRRAGGVDESLHYVMDTELWIRFYKLGARLEYINSYLWAFRLHEQSKTSSSVITGARSDRFLIERKRIRDQHGIARLDDIIAVFLKRLGCMISFGYIRRMLFVMKNKGKHINVLCK